MAAAIALVSCGTQKKTNITATDAVREGQSTTEEKIVAEKAEEGSGVSMISSSEVRRHDYGGHEAFSLELLEKVNVNPAANVAVSPFSAGMALTMLAQGAYGQTWDEILAALRYDAYSEGPAYGVPGYLGPGEGLSREDIPGEISRAKQYAQQCGISLNSANSVWVSDGISVKDGFKTVLENDFGAQFFGRDFSSAKTVEEINAWCSDHTAGKIPSIIDEINPMQKLLLLNALYFKAPWLHQFKESATSKDVFHGLGGDTKVDFMHQTENFGYYEALGHQVAILPYQGGTHGMVIVLPSKDTDVNDLISSLDYKLVRRTLSLVDYRKRVELSLPKFKMETDMLLNGTLREMGVKKVFDQDADFSRMSDAPLAVDEVRQKCYLAVDEQGSEAAAVTSVSMRLTAMPNPADTVVMKVDRPFLFAIISFNTNEILFEGKIVTINE